jgi:Glycosyl transferases group 1
MPSQKPRVLLFSQRNIFKGALFRCALYEFEDIIAEVDSVDILAPRVDVSSRRYNLARRLAYRVPMVLSAGGERVGIKSDYDLFLAVFGFSSDLLMLKSIGNWRDRCKTAVCLIDELWIKQFDTYRYFLDALKDFDVVVLYYSQSAKPLSERIQRKCVSVPPGVDAIRFSPYPEPPQRSIDVCSIGRRSEVTHRSLLKMADKEGIFYLHDTLSASQAINASEHRALTANIVKRSRYFIVNPGLIDQPERRGNQMEIGNRYFEGAAAGAILLGERPENDAFSRLFDWPDALIHLPYNSSNVDEIIHQLDGEPDRQEAIRRRNVVNALRRHDWVYRWESILQSAGLAPLPQLLERKERLGRIADAVAESGLAGQHLIPA